jgi:hypothetical protein
MDRPRHECEPLQVFKFFKGPQGFEIRDSIVARLRRDYLGKIIFVENFYK